jgi:hypothetical protein
MIIGSVIKLMKTMRQIEQKIAEEKEKERLEENKEQGKPKDPQNAG